jgi:transcriptional regulator with XRE-family HTH domain
MTDETIGTRIKRLRLERGLSQRQLCEGLDRVSSSYLSRVEADGR